MTRPDDCSLTREQLLTVRRHADTLLKTAGASGIYPTPISDLMSAAKLTIVDDQLLDESLLRRFLKGAKASFATLKSALSKVLGLFEPHERLVVIDRDTPAPRVPFLKLHEAGHGCLPHQSGIYKLIHDCEKTLDPEISDLFEREANTFASEVLFQGDIFRQQASQSGFSISVPIALAKKFGASNYAAFRRYVSTNEAVCCVVVLEPVVTSLDGGFTAEVRRVVASHSFHEQFDCLTFSDAVNSKHPLGPIVPINRRMTRNREVVLTDRNGERHVCTAEAFDTKHQIFLLLCWARKKNLMVVVST